MKDNLTFDSLCDYLKDIPNISYGGCGVSALAMFKFLSSKSEPVDLVFLYSDEAKEVLIANICAESVAGAVPVGATHCAIRYKGEIIDHDRKPLPIGTYKLFTTIEFVCEEEVKDAVRNRRGWNTKFDRATYIPTVEAFLGELLELN